MNSESSGTKRVKINLSMCQYPILEEVRRELHWESDSEDTCDIIWQDSALTPIALSQLTPFQRINHFPAIFAISRKDYLAKNLKSMELLHPSEFSFFPETWVLPQELTSLKNYLSTNSPVLICKPPNKSQGKGIFLTKCLADIPEMCVVQKYMDNPYLIDGYKFDLRLYVLVTGFDPLRVYIHNEGLVRLATSIYYKPTDMNMLNSYMHLTNYAINKNSPNYVKNKSSSDIYTGHKRSFQMFLAQLQEDGENVEKLMKRIDDIVLKTLCTVQPFVSHNYRSSQPNDSYSAICFQILGFDIFLDSRLRPSLLEVNHTPSFTVDTPLDRSVKKAVIKDCLKMVGVKSDCKNKFKGEFINYLNEKTYKSFCIVKSMKNEKKEKFLEAQIENENFYQGGYRRIFPCDDQEKYMSFIKSAQDVYNNKQLKKKRPTTEENKPIIRVRKSSVSYNSRSKVTTVRRRTSVNGEKNRRVLPTILF